MSSLSSNDASRSPIRRGEEVLERAETVTYKQVEDGPDLKAHVFLPDGHDPKNDSRTAILFFFGSGWDIGSPIQFAPQALHFAGRGAVSILIDYRVGSSHPDVGPIAAMQDARSAVRWARFYADKLGVDPGRIVASGALAGAHIAASAALNTEFADDDTDPPIDGEPDALILFSPIIDLGKGDYGADRFKNAAAMKEAGLSRFIRRDLPPVLVFHGMRDRLSPVENVERFTKKYRRKKNICEFNFFEARENSFFNLNVDPEMYEFCLNEADRFLVEHGFLDEKEESEGESNVRLVS